MLRRVENNFGRKENLYVDDFDDCVKDSASGQINMPNFTKFGEVTEPHQESGSNESAAPRRTSNEGSPMRNSSSSLQAQPTKNWSRFFTSLVQSPNPDH